MYNKKIQFKFVNRILIIMMLFTCFVPISNVKADCTKLGTEEISSLLIEYSQYLMNGTTKSEGSFSSETNSLIQERREFYQDFFEIGLHSQLDAIKSEFVTDDSLKLLSSGGTQQIKVTEVVTMDGMPWTTKSDTFPLVKAGEWALENTKDPAVIEALEIYVKSMEEGVAASVKEGVQIVFIIQHDIEVGDKDGSPQIISDEFSDKSIDNVEGFDNISWENSKLIREGSDLKNMPDYVIYNTPIEELGKTLLDDYTNTYGGMPVSTKGTGFFYSRGAAVNYINTYSSNTSNICSGSTVTRNTSYYNSSYSGVYNATGCSDCVDYVSQALKAGAFPTDSTWYPSYYSSAWVYTTSLNSYLNSLAAVESVAQTSLVVGDISYTSGYGHVVMIGGVNPYRFGGHTNDRLLYPWSSSLTIYSHVKNYIP